MKAIALIAALSTTFAVAFWLTPSFARLDDAYIALHSARVVLSGHDPIYQVPALVGVTSPAYVALLTVIIGAGVIGLEHAQGSAAQNASKSTTSTNKSTSTTSASGLSSSSAPRSSSGEAVASSGGS